MASKKSGLAKGKGLQALGLSESYKEQFSNTGDKVKSLPIDSVFPNPNQPRKRFNEDDMATLVESVKLYGVFQPILVRKEGEGYQIIAGERRWRASKLAGLESIPALIKNYSTEEMTEVALIENLQRQNLDPIEEAFAYEALMNTFKQTQEVIASRLGRSRSHVANMIRLLQLPEPIRNELSEGEITIGQARPLLGLKTEKLQLAALAEIKEKDLNARQVEALVKSFGVSKKRTVKPQASAEVKELVDRLKLSLGTSVAIHVKNAKKVQGKIEITFKSEKELLHLIEYLDNQKGEDRGEIEGFHV